MNGSTRTARAAAPAPTRAAKSNEWVKPRCPKGCAYGIQGVNSASASGRTGSRIDAIRSRRSDAAPKAGLIAVNPIAPWVKMVGIMFESEYNEKINHTRRARRKDGSFFVFV